MLAALGRSDPPAARGFAPFGVQTRVARAGLVLALRGEFDLAAVPAFEEAFAQVADHDDGPLLLDLADLSFIDSSGVSSLVSTLARLRAEGRTMSVCEPARQVENVLALTGLLERLPRVSRPTDAVAWPTDESGVV